MRIERIAQGAAVTLRLIGRIQVEHLGELERQIAASGATTMLDLEEVILVDIDVVRFLASCRGKGIVLVNCSPYINEWIAKEAAVTAAQLPLTSLSEDIAVTRRLLSMQQGPTLLVGHSYGGAVITGAANDAPQVTGLVYIAGWGVDEGESLEDLAKQGAPPAGAAQVYPDEFGFLWIKREGFAAAFAGDADPMEASVMAATQKPLSVKSFTDKSGPAAWKHLPSWYLISGGHEVRKAGLRLQ